MQHINLSSVDIIMKVEINLDFDLLVGMLK
jgi:hypothetical protein